MAHKPYMPFYTAEYMNDTAHLTMAEHGAYLLLIIHYWHTEKPLPDDDKKLAQICKTTLKGFRRIKLTVSLLFTHRGNTLVHKRIEKEIKEYYEKLDAKRLSGKLGAEKRWNNLDGRPIADPWQTHSGPIVSPMAKNSYTDTDTDTDTHDIHRPDYFSGKKGNLRTEGVEGTVGAEPKKFRSAPAPSASPVFIFIPARGDEEFGVTEEVVRELEISYPHFDVRTKLQYMRMWSLSNPKKRKTMGGMLRFINNWFLRDNDKLNVGMENRKLSAVEHNQLLLERRRAQRKAEELKSLSAPTGEENNVAH